jgi:tetratricopeptide (TPR) repeat protein
MNRIVTIFAFLCAALFVVGCGKGLVESGDEAFAQKNYNEALKYYLEAKKELPDDASLKEKIAISYFREGELFYEKRRVIKAFEARVKNGMKFVPKNPSSNLVTEVSQIYLKLAFAYKQTKAENPYQKKQFLDRSLDYIERALAQDSTNADAVAALQEYKEEHFMSLKEKGLLAYKKGAQDPLQFIAADYYLTQSLKLDPENPEANKYMRLSRKKALNLLDPGMDVPIAVTDRMENEQYVAFLVVVYNLLPENLYVTAEHLYLVKKDGAAIRGKTSGMFTTALESKTLVNGQEMAGVVAFPLPDNKNYARLEFRKDGEVLGYKNLP